MKGTFKDRPVEISQMHYASDPVDCFIESAYYTDSQDYPELTDEECQQMSEQCPELMYEAWMEHQIDRADFLYDSMRDY